MASHILSHSIFILFFISANGRPLQMPQNGHLKAISRASSSSYTTNYQDVLGLYTLANKYSLLMPIFATDPCVYPVWDWIECNTASTPRVIALNMYGKLLFGQLPDFSSMTALQRIDASGNVLEGPIPSFLGTFPLLQELNLANNYLSGTVPSSLCNNKNLKLTIYGNSMLSTCSSTSSKTPPTPGSINSGGSIGSGSGSGSGSGDVYRIPSTTTKRKSSTPKILGGLISVFVILGAVVGGCAIRNHRANAAAAIAQAAAVPAGPIDQNVEAPMEEVPVDVLPNHMRPAQS